MMTSSRAKCSGRWPRLRRRSVLRLALTAPSACSCSASIEAAAIARTCFHQLPKLRELWQQLQRPTLLGPTGLELVKATLVAEQEVAWPEGEEVARKLIAGVEGGTEQLRELDRMAEELGGRRSYESWREGVLGLHRELDQLLEDPTWRDPGEVLDPGGDLGVDTGRLTRLCIARLKNLTPRTPQKHRLLTVLEHLTSQLPPAREPIRRSVPPQPAAASALKTHRPRDVEEGGPDRLHGEAAW